MLCFFNDIWSNSTREVEIKQDLSTRHNVGPEKEEGYIVSCGYGARRRRDLDGVFLRPFFRHGDGTLLVVLVVLCHVVLSNSS
jgi:hypothetical protein